MKLLNLACLNAAPIFLETDIYGDLSLEYSLIVERKGSDYFCEIFIADNHSINEFC